MRRCGAALEKLPRGCLTTGHARWPSRGPCCSWLPAGSLGGGAAGVSWLGAHRALRARPGLYRPHCLLSGVPGACVHVCGLWGGASLLAQSSKSKCGLDFPPSWAPGEEGL